ncbi:MAG: membrane protein [Bacteroidales bacterium]|nr:MAG: membrane protein [Bacteroidales bacterium]
MLKAKEEKLFSREWFIAYGFIVLGSLIFAAGDVMIVNPYRLAPGGTYGLANVFNTIMPWKISYYAFMMDIPLLLIGTLILGPRFGIKTIVSTFLILFFVWIFESFWGYDPIIHNGMLKEPNAEGLMFVPDYFLNTLVGGLVYGIAIGLIFKSGATSGGSDIIAMILNKYTKISLGKLVMAVDMFITLSTLIAFGELRLPFYSIFLIFVEGKIIDFVIEGFKSNKTVFIITTKVEPMRQMIINELGRGGTILKGVGLYNGIERDVIYTSITRREYVRLKDRAHEIDSQAFVNVMDSSEVIGKGFKNFAE